MQPLYELADPPVAMGPNALQGPTAMVTLERHNTAQHATHTLTFDLITWSQTMESNPVSERCTMGDRGEWAISKYFKQYNEAVHAMYGTMEEI